MSDDAEPKPILWVGLTETGRAFADAEHLDRVQDRIEDAVGEEYHVVVADDTVRLADREKVQTMLEQIVQAAVSQGIVDVEDGDGS